MRVLALAADLPSAEDPQRGRFIAEHVRAVALHHDVRVVHLRLARAAMPRVRWTRGPRLNGMPAIAVLDAKGPPVLAELAAARAVARQQPDLVHSHALESLLTASFVGAFTRVPWVHTEHSSEWPVPTARGRYARLLALAKRRAGRADRVTAVSRYLADAMRVTVDPERITVVPNVVDLSTIPCRPAPSDGRRLRLVSVGSLTAQKRPWLAIEALDRLRRREPTCHLTWIGGGPLAAEFDRQIADFGLTPHVTRLPFLSHEEYLAQVRAADVLLLPSAYETFCVAAAEALASGIPVVLGDRGGHREFVTPEIGFCVGGERPESYADAVLAAWALARNRPPSAFRKPMAQFGRERVAAMFDVVLDAAATTAATRR